ncbi:MAG: cytochrome b5-like heme/steroid binding domain-containing protein [Minisyncoccia bacterium]
MKYILIIVALVAAGVIGYTVYEKQTEVENTDSNTVVQTQQEQKTEDDKVDDDADKNDDDSKPVVAPTPVVTKPAVTVKTFTMAEVALHADTTSCYSVINGSVYDLTTWIPKHPGGERAIKGICGKDGSDGFNGKHGGKPQQESTLASFKIGTLVK